MRATAKKAPAKKMQNGGPTYRKATDPSPRKMIDSTTPKKYKPKSTNPTSGVGQKGGEMKKMQKGGGYGNTTEGKLSFPKTGMKKGGALKKKAIGGVSTGMMSMDSEAWPGKRKKPKYASSAYKKGGKRKINKSCKKGNCTPMRG